MALRVKHPPQRGEPAAGATPDLQYSERRSKSNLYDGLDNRIFLGVRLFGVPVEPRISLSLEESLLLAAHRRPIAYAVTTPDRSIRQARTLIGTGTLNPIHS
jgi:hypothetical protein